LNTLKDARILYSDMNDQLLKCLFDDQVCVMLTDTVYGVVARLDSETAVKKIYELKHRDDNKAVGTILVGSIEQISPYVTDEQLLQKVSHFWPGPTSVILPVKDTYSYAKHQADGLAFRIPNDEKLQTMLQQTGPLASSSANLQGEPTAQTIDEARDYFGDAIECYVDGGEKKYAQPSRVVRIRHDGTIEIIRS
jgi:L-threonylcarbamoyladenylate synthase